MSVAALLSITAPDGIITQRLRTSQIAVTKPGRLPGERPKMGETQVRFFAELLDVSHM